MMLKVSIFIINLYFVLVLSQNELNWSNFMKHAKRNTNQLTNYVQPILSDILFKQSNVSDQCTKSLIRYMNGIKSLEPWAIHMLDATGRIPSGFLSGTKIDFGSFEQCLEIRVNELKDYSSFKGQFCMVDIKTPLIKPLNWKTPRNKSYIETYGYPPDWIYSIMEEQHGLLSTFGLYMGVCFPSTCSKEDIVNLYKHTISQKAFEVSVTDCQVDKPKEWPTPAVIAWYLVLSLVIACTVGTILDVYDVWQEKTGQKNDYKSFHREVMKAFSLCTNAKKLFENPKYKNNLHSFHGLRIFCSMFVIWEHTFTYPTFWKENKYSNYNRVLKMISFPTIIIENMFMFIEIYFIISGFLMMHSTWRSLEKSYGKINIFTIIIRKYFRLVPTQLFVILLSFILPVLHNGPIWNSTWEEEINRCEKFGWRNIFLIHNFSPMKDLCWLNTWYIGALIQIQIISLLLIVLIYRNPKKGIALTMICVGVCFIHDFIISYQNKFVFPCLYSMKSFDIVREFVSKLYIKPYNHFFSHSVGMLTGWFVLKFGDRKLTPVQHGIGCVIYGIFSLFILFAIWLPTDNILLTSIHNAGRNWIFSSCFSWILYILFTGQIETLSRLLSANVLIPFSQISYSVYLIHVVWIVFKDASSRTRTSIAILDHVCEFVINVVMSFILAFVIYLIIEAPFNKLCDLCTGNDSSSGSIKSLTKEKNLLLTNKVLSIKDKDDFVNKKCPIINKEQKVLCEKCE